MAMRRPLALPFDKNGTGRPLRIDRHQSAAGMTEAGATDYRGSWRSLGVSKSLRSRGDRQGRMLGDGGIWKAARLGGSFRPLADGRSRIGASLTQINDAVAAIAHRLRVCPSRASRNWRRDGR